MKTSKFRHTTAHPVKNDLCYLNAQPSPAVWDCANFLAASANSFALPWQTLGGVVVLKYNQVGKLPSTPPMLLGHEGHVIDLQYSPFDDDLLFTASEDCTVRLWRIPEGGVTANINTPLQVLKGHGKKVGILAHHPSALNVLATASTDNLVKIWDVERGEAKSTVSGFHGEQITSVNWNLDGSLINTTAKDRKLRIIDVRTNTLVAQVEAHEGTKTQRSIWAKRQNVIATIGFNKRQFRQAMIWDARSLEKAIFVHELDQQSGIVMPFYDEDTGMLFLGGKGDGNIKMFELWKENPPLAELKGHATSDPQKGLAMLPKRVVNVKDCEVTRFLKLTTKLVQPISFVLPRKTSQMEFQEDVFPPTFSNVPALSAEQYFAGTNAQPQVIDMRAKFDGTALTTSAGTNAVYETASTTTAPAPTAPATTAFVATPVAPVEVAAPAPAATPAPAQPTPLPQAAKSATPPPAAVVEWDGKSVATEEQVQRQRTIVDKLQKELKEAEERLGKMLPKPATPQPEEVKPATPKPEEAKAEAAEPVDAEKPAEEVTPKPESA